MLLFSRTGVLSKPDPAGDLLKLGPLVMPGAASEMDQHHSFAASHEFAQVLARGFPGAGRFPGLEMENHCVVLVQCSRFEKVRVLDGGYLKPRIFAQPGSEDGAGFAPMVARIIDAGDEQNSSVVR